MDLGTDGNGGAGRLLRDLQRRRHLDGDGVGVDGATGSVTDDTVSPAVAVGFGHGEAAGAGGGGQHIGAEIVSHIPAVRGIFALDRHGKLRGGAGLESLGGRLADDLQVAGGGNGVSVGGDGIIRPEGAVKTGVGVMAAAEGTGRGEEPFVVVWAQTCIPGGVHIVVFAVQLHNVPGMVGYLSGGGDGAGDAAGIHTQFQHQLIEQHGVACADSGLVDQCGIGGVFESVGIVVQIGIVIADIGAHIVIYALYLLIIGVFPQIQLLQKLVFPVGEGGLLFGSGGVGHLEFVGEIVVTVLGVVGGGGRTALPAPVHRVAFGGNAGVDGAHLPDGMEAGHVILIGLYVDREGSIAGFKIVTDLPGSLSFTEVGGLVHRLEDGLTLIRVDGDGMVISVQGVGQPDVVGMVNDRLRAGCFIGCDRDFPGGFRGICPENGHREQRQRNTDGHEQR